MKDDDTEEELKKELEKKLSEYEGKGKRVVDNMGFTHTTTHYSRPEPAYPECQECLDSLGYGLVAWERHLERDHDKDFFQKVPFCSTLSAHTPVHLSNVHDIMEELKIDHNLPTRYHYPVLLGLKLAVALTMQEMARQMLRKKDNKDTSDGFWTSDER